MLTKSILKITLYQILSMSKIVTNNLKQILTDRFKWHKFSFPPELTNYGFYPKRWWDLLNNNTTMRLDEAIVLSEYFSIPIKDLMKDLHNEKRDPKVSKKVS